jgi:predicted transcriptional regulator
MDQKISPNAIQLSVDIAAAYFGSRSVPVEQIPQVLTLIYKAVLSASDSNDAPLQPKQEPAVPIRKSITPEYIICLEDGRKYKSIKRHIKLTYGMTPEDYRTKWGLPDDYPMVAPAYSAMRSSLARTLGLGFVREAGGKAVGRKARR